MTIKQYDSIMASTKKIQKPNKFRGFFGKLQNTALNFSPEYGSLRSEFG